MLQISYGIPLLIAVAATVMPLAEHSKRLHSIGGMFLLLLSVAHGWQHRRNIMKDWKRGKNKLGLFDALQVPKTKLDLFVRSVEISTYLPGRIRLHSRSLIGNASLQHQVMDYLRSFREISEVEINKITGSILIKYTPQFLHTNPELTRIETYIRTHAVRR